LGFGITLNVKLFVPVTDLNSPLKVDPTSGKLDYITIKYFENKAGGPLAQMQSESSISGYKVFVDPDQNVLATSILAVSIKMIPYGTARTININCINGI
jgi:hypothetical protein